MVDLTGRKFGRLTVQRSVLIKNRTKWECLCECGNIVNLPKTVLEKGMTKSCGCYQKEARVSHGLTNSREYKTWTAMKNRCFNQKNKAYKDYGGRGITVCDRWLESFENFLEDMGPRPGKEYSINRINNDLDYTPDNCCWSTAKEQQRNRRVTNYVIFKNEKYSLPDLCEKYNIDLELVRKRLRYGWSVEDAILKPIRFHRKIN